MINRTRKIAIVGNAPTSIDYSDRIDAADHVVRFNNAFGYGTLTGSCIDDLYLVNCGGQMFEWLTTGELWNRDYLQATPQVTLPFQAQNEQSGLEHYETAIAAEKQGVNFEHDVRPVLCNLGKTVSTLSARQYAEGTRVVCEGRSKDTAVPSTGFLAIHTYLAQRETTELIELFGFGFAGWNGHNWARERDWTLAQQARGNLRIFPTA